MALQTTHRRMIRKVIRPFKIDKVMEGEGEEGGGGALDETQVKKIILQFEKRALKNQVQTLQNTFVYLSIYRFLFMYIVYILYICISILLSC